MLKCKKCRFENKDNSKFCKSCGKSLQEELKETQEKTSELSMVKEGYFKGNMCPFTVASIGGTDQVYPGVGSISHYTWKHLECIGRFCRLWDNKENECSFKVMVEILKKRMKR
jgi:hypothetical protein